MGKAGVGALSGTGGACYGLGFCEVILGKVHTSVNSLWTGSYQKAGADL